MSSVCANQWSEEVMGIIRGIPIVSIDYHLGNRFQITWKNNSTIIAYKPLKLIHMVKNSKYECNLAEPDSFKALWAARAEQRLLNSKISYIYITDGDEVVLNWSDPKDHILVVTPHGWLFKE